MTASRSNASQPNASQPSAARPNAAQPGEAVAIELAVTGMVCDGCAATVTRVLKQVPGVVDARVDLASGHASVRTSSPVQALLAAVRAAGFEAHAS